MLDAYALDSLVEAFDRWFNALIQSEEAQVDALDEIAAHCRQRVETED